MRQLFRPNSHIGSSERVPSGKCRSIADFTISYIHSIQFTGTQIPVSLTIRYNLFESLDFDPPYRGSQISISALRSSCEYRESLRSNIPALLENLAIRPDTVVTNATQNAPVLSSSFVMLSFTILGEWRQATTTLLRSRLAAYVVIANVLLEKIGHYLNFHGHDFLAQPKLSCL